MSEFDGLMDEQSAVNNAGNTAPAATNAVANTNGGAVSVTTSEAALKALEDTAGVTVGDIGMKVSRVPIEKYKASTQRVDRIGFVTKGVIAVKTHFVDGVGSILCFGKKCCEISGVPTVRYLFPVVVYSTDNEGNIVGKKVDLRILSAGEDLYKSIITINRATASTGGIDSVDLLVTCTDDKYQKITLNQAGPAAWKKSTAATKLISERWASDAEYAYMAIARKVDEAAFLQLVGVEAGAGAGAGAPGGQFDETANADLGKFFDD